MAQMLYQKHGWPDEDELLLCTVTSVQYNSVFCTLDEYGGRTGMIHISEVTAGRIRNIRDYVQEGRKVVCKVLRVDQEKGHIDLSLRRVNERQRREKMDALKQETKAENLIASLAKELKKDPNKFYDEIAPQIFEHYEYLHQAFQDIADGEFSLSQTKLDKKVAESLEALVKDRIKPTEVAVEGKLTIQTFSENGVDAVRKALIEARKLSETGDIRYLGAGQYKVVVKAEEYKDAEKLLDKAIQSVEKAFKKTPAATVAFERMNE